MGERRRGYNNVNGVASTALARNERDGVYGFDQYAIADWSFAPRWKLTAGVRHSAVNFRVKDDFITVTPTVNPDDSGTQRYSQTSPAAGVSYELTDATRVYVAAGRGFETPTQTELAYRPDGTPGLNTGLKAATSANYEAGMKTLPGDRGRANLARFRTDTRNDIVVATSGGRASYFNAAKTRREGVELSAEGRLGGGFTAVLAWRYAPLGFVTAVEGRRSGRVYVNDANSDAAESYTVFNWRGGFEQRLGEWKFAEFVRVDNFTSREYVGSVIVNNNSPFEPAPTRTWLAGANASYAF